MASKSLGTLTLDLVAKIGGFTEPLDKAGRALDKQSKSMSATAKRLGTDIGLGLSAAFGVATTALGIYVRNTIEAEKVQAQLAARIKSTGGAAGLALKDLNAMADALQDATTFDDEAIGGAQSVLLTFTKVTSENFARATEAVLDMSTAMGSDLNSAALQVGKALNDPIQGIAALSRVGVQFTKDQKEVIENLVETGQTAKAQAIILKELETQMGGSARAARDTLGGALQGLKNTLDNLLEGDSGSEGMKGAVQAVNDLNASLRDPELKRGIDSLAEGLLGAANAAVQGAAKLGSFIGEYKQFLADRGFIEGNTIAQLEERRDKLVKFKGTLRGRLLFNESDLNKEITQVDNLIDSMERASKFAGLVGGSSSTETAPGATPVGGGGGGGKARASGQSAAAKAARELEAAVRALSEADADLYAQSLQLVDAQSQSMMQWVDLTAHLDGPLKVAEVEHIKRLQEIEQVGKAAGATAQAIAAAKAKEADAYNATTEAIRAQAEAMANEDLIRGMDSFRDIAYDFLVDLPGKGKGAWRDFLDDLTAQLNRWAANGIVDQLFGKQGTTGQGTAGGGWLGSIIDALGSSGSSQGSLLDLFSSFGSGGTYGGGRAGGGPVMAGSFYQVGENDRPEVLMSRGRQYLIPGDRGTVRPMRSNGGSVVSNNTFYLGAPESPATQQQIAEKTARELQIAAARR